MTRLIEVGGYEFEVDVEVTDYQPQEPKERYYPGCPEEIYYVVSIFGQELPDSHPIAKGVNYKSILREYHEKYEGNVEKDWFS